MIAIALTILLASIITSNGFIKFNQSFEIHGQFICGEQPLHRAAVELWEDNRSLLKSAIYVLMQRRGNVNCLLLTFLRSFLIRPYFILF